MGKKEKLLEKARHSSKNLRFDELLKLAEYHDFIFKRQKGSHMMMKHRDKPIFMNFQNKNGEAKPFQVKQLLSAIDEYNL